MSVENLLTADEAAKFIGCSSGRVRQMCREGIIAGKKAGKRLWLVPLQEADKVRNQPYQMGRPRKSQKAG